MVFENIESFESILEKSDIEAAKKHIALPSGRTPSAVQDRSYLMLSANRVKHLNKLDTLDADNVIINLEDGVSPEQKPIARHMAALFISNLKASHTKLVVRVNPLGEGGEEDIALMNTVKPDAIRVAKIRTIEDAKKACELIDPEIDVHFSIETKEAFGAIPPLKTEARVTTFYLGILDLLADLGIPQSAIAFGNPTIDHLLAKFLTDCRIAGVEPVFFTYQEYPKLETFRHWCKQAKAMGYRGTSCLSPGQVKVAHEVFGHSKEELDKARYVIERFEAMAAQGITGFTDERYGFIDEPIYKGALGILSKP